MFGEDDFSIDYEWMENGDKMLIKHFYVDEEHRGTGRASAILETLVRVAYYEGASTVQVSMGGGKEAEEFLTSNGFMITRQREYQHANQPDNIEGEYGVDAIRSLN